MSSRKDALQSLLRFDQSLEATVSELQKYPWDADDPLVTLDPATLRSVLSRFLSGELSADEIGGWANAIEGRDDVEYGELREIIHELANPLLTSPLTPATAQELIGHALVRP